jgi:hypothetical protein
MLSIDPALNIQTYEGIIRGRLLYIPSKKLPAFNMENIITSRFSNTGIQLWTNDSYAPYPPRYGISAAVPCVLHSVIAHGTEFCVFRSTCKFLASSLIIN